MWGLLGKYLAATELRPAAHWPPPYVAASPEAELGTRRLPRQRTGRVPLLPYEARRDGRLRRDQHSVQRRRRRARRDRSDIGIGAPNLTPDPTSSPIAAWDEATFVTRFRAARCSRLGHAVGELRRDDRCRRPQPVSLSALVGARPGTPGRRAVPVGAAALTDRVTPRLAGATLSAARRPVRLDRSRSLYWPGGRMARPVVQDPGDTPAVARTSPRYCRYNGFLLGQFLSLGLRRCGASALRRRRARLLAFLREVEVDVAIPASPHDRGDLPTPASCRRSCRAWPCVARAGRVRDPRRAADAIRPGVPQGRRGGLGDAASRSSACGPSTSCRPSSLRFAVPAHETDPDRSWRRPSPTCARLSPACRSRATRRSSSCRSRPPTPATTRASTGRPSSTAAFAPSAPGAALAGADHAYFLLLALMRKAGLVWADVSQLYPAAACEIGAAQALGKVGVLVASEGAPTPCRPTSAAIRWSATNCATRSGRTARCC